MKRHKLLKSITPNNINSEGGAMESSVSADSMDTKKKLPLKSIQGYRCLTRCYQKGVEYLHPVLLTGVRDNKNDSCAIEPITKIGGPDNEETTGPYKEVIHKQCKLEDNNIYQHPDELESILSSFSFNPTVFLANIYGLNSFDGVIYWTLENDFLPFDTIKRVHNCAWKAFGYKLSEISNTVLEYYYDIAKDKWLQDYVYMIRNKYSFNWTLDHNTDKPKATNAIDDIYEIILEKFFTYHFFTGTIKRYIYEYQNDWEYIDSHYGHIKNFVFKQLIHNIDQYFNAKNK
jgi:hypothetical protein